MLYSDGFLIRGNFYLAVMKEEALVWATPILVEYEWKLFYDSELLDSTTPLSSFSR